MNFMNMMNMVSGLYPWARIVRLWICHSGGWTGAAPAPPSKPQYLSKSYQDRLIKTSATTAIMPNILFYLVGPHGLEPWTKGL